MPSEAVAVTLQVTKALESLDISYAIGGSMASTTHGRIRSTMDVDMIVAIEDQHVRSLLDELGNAFYADEQSIRQAVARGSSFNLIHLTTLFKVDVFVAKNRLFDHQQLNRRQSQLLEPPDHRAYVATAEDVVLAKLDWFKMGGGVSDRQWRDIQGVLDVQGARLDRGYLQHWASELGVGDLLQKVLDEYESRQDQSD